MTMTFNPFIVASLTWLLMLVAYYLPRLRFFHIPVMSAIIAFDVGMPLYLYTHRDWWKQLIEQQDIFSFLTWMHFGLLAVMYALELVQVLTARRLLNSDETARKDHHSQGRALLWVRAMVIVSGGLLAPTF
jgi:hypothetical protein